LISRMDSTIYSPANDLCYGGNMLKETPNETLGQRLVRLRLQRGWRYQKDLAKAIGADPSTLNQIEKDRRMPSGGTADALARVLNVPKDELLYGDTSARKATAPSPPPTPRASLDQRAQTPPAVSTDAYKDSGSSSSRGSSGGSTGTIEPLDLRAIIRASSVELLYDIAHAIIDFAESREQSAHPGRQVAGIGANPPRRLAGHRAHR
jgi:transcriptional regulator with XRE-family HTH domain